MRVLAFETATRRLSTALWQDGALLERSEILANGGSERLLPWVHELLAEAGIGLAQLDGIAFGAGPGGFTGLRLSCGLAQGLAYGLDLPVWPVSTLEALALAAAPASVSSTIWAVLDARMNEVYCATYRVDPTEVDPFAASVALVTALSEPVCVAPAVAPAPTFSDVRGVGDGFLAYGEVLTGLRPDWLEIQAEVFPSAAAVARLAVPAFLRGAGLPAQEAQPVYVRDKVALTTAERLARGGVR